MLILDLGPGFEPDLLKSEHHAYCLEQLLLTSKEHGLRKEFLPCLKCFQGVFELMELAATVNGTANNEKQLLLAIFVGQLSQE